MPQKGTLKLPEDIILPNHIAVVLDGNGRWARSRGLPVTRGHEAGAKALRQVLEYCRNIGVHTLTIWGWSTENWKRPLKEKQKIFELIGRTIKEEISCAQKEGVRFCHLGRKDRLPRNLVNLIKKSEEETKNNKKYILNVALDYGGRDEIIRAFKKIFQDKIPIKKIDEELVSSYLDTADQPYPNPDLFIRTSGEQRTSGLMPWQTTYAEFYFEEDHLPDMTLEKLRAILLDYNCRRRRFGAKDKVTHFRFKPEVVAGLELKWWRLSKIPEGTRFRDFVSQYLIEQYGLSKTLAKHAAEHMMKALIHGKKNEWRKAKAPLKSFYELIRDHLKLAFEPEIVTSLKLKFWQDLNGKQDLRQAVEVEETARNLFAEEYRISNLQAAKAAHLRVLAKIEQNLAEQGHGDHHWEKAEDYLHKFYQALKDRVA